MDSDNLLFRRLEFLRDRLASSKDSNSCKLAVMDSHCRTPCDYMRLPWIDENTTNSRDVNGAVSIQFIGEQWIPKPMMYDIRTLPTATAQNEQGQCICELFFTRQHSGRFGFNTLLRVRTVKQGAAESAARASSGDLHSGGRSWHPACVATPEARTGSPLVREMPHPPTDQPQRSQHHRTGSAVDSTTTQHHAQPQQSPHGIHVVRYQCRSREGDMMRHKMQRNIRT